MQDGISSIFTVWANFYVVTGSSAAALIGLMFVVVTLTAQRLREFKERTTGFGVFSTPTVVHFGSAFLFSVLMLAPWRSLAYISGAIGVSGLVGFVYVCYVMHRISKLTVYVPPLEDWIWFGILPFLAYAATLATAIMLALGESNGLYSLAAATVLLVFIGIHNAWDVVTYLLIYQPEGDLSNTDPLDDETTK